MKEREPANARAKFKERRRRRRTGNHNLGGILNRAALYPEHIMTTELEWYQILNTTVVEMAVDSLQKTTTSTEHQSVVIKTNRILRNYRHSWESQSST